MRAKMLRSFHADDRRSLHSYHMRKNFTYCFLLNVAKRNTCPLLRMIEGGRETWETQKKSIGVAG